MTPISLSALLALAALLAAGCTATDHWGRMAGRLGTPNGAILLFDPATCEITSDLLAQLNSLDNSPNARVLGFVLDTDTVGTPLTQVARDFNISFRLESASRRQLRPILGSSPLRLPVLLVYRFGALVSLESVEPGRGSLNRYITTRRP